MLTRRTAAFAALIISAVGAAPTVALADTAATNVIYVDGSSSSCTDSGTGTSAAPFCTLQAGVNAAAAGDTVEVTGGSGVLYAPVTVSASGTAAAPITIESTGTTLVGLPAGSTNTAPAFTIDGAHYVTITGFNASGVTSALASVTDSSNVTLDRMRARLTAGEVSGSQPVIEVAGSASAVTISRNELLVNQLLTAPVIQIDAGSSDDVVTTNVIENTSDSVATSYPPVVSVLGAADTAVASNTISTGPTCGAAVGVTGASGGSSIENNILATSEGNCVTGTTPTGLVVVTDSASAPVTSDYNILYPLATVPDVLDDYVWNGTLYGSLSTFTTATGEGAHDLNADPAYIDFPSPSETSPAIGSANSAAPGMLSTDYFRKSCMYDAYAAITGAGNPAYCSRGAVQYQPSEAENAAFSLQANGALSVTATLAQPLVNPQGYTYAWGDGQTTRSTDTAETHTYADPGTYTVTVTATDALGESTSAQSSFTPAGSDFTAYGPVRLLDTRNGTGATQGPVTSGSTVRLKIAGSGSIPTGLTAVAVNLTAVDGTGSGYITAYADGTSKPSVSNLNYGDGTTVANEAIVPVGADGMIELTNTGINSSVSVDLIADVTGYFTQTAAAGFAAVTPARILDTRKGLGAAQAQVAPLSSIKLAIDGADGGVLPGSGITAVSLHVTAVDTAANGYVTVYPDGESTPTASNLNYATGSTVSNTVIVPVGADGEIDLYNGSPTGYTDLIADVNGYYTTTPNSTTASYIPQPPYRALDTRGDFQPVWADTSVGVQLTVPGASAYVMNLTAVEATGNGFLTAAPTGGTVPNVSNLNYLQNQTVANLAQVATGSSSTDEPITITNSEISTHMETSVEIIADVFGYYSHD